jgi:hypothetical protein
MSSSAGEAQARPRVVHRAPRGTASKGCGQHEPGVHVAPSAAAGRVPNAIKFSKRHIWYLSMTEERLGTQERWQSILVHGAGKREFDVIRQATRRGLPLGDRNFIAGSNVVLIERSPIAPSADRVLFLPLRGSHSIPQVIRHRTKRPSAVPIFRSSSPGGTIRMAARCHARGGTALRCDAVRVHPLAAGHTAQL